MFIRQFINECQRIHTPMNPLFLSLMLVPSLPDGRSNPNYPPLPGYTGYIPKMKPTDLGIGRTFSAAARRGLAQVSIERESREVLNAGLHVALPSTRPTTTPS